MSGLALIADAAVDTLGTGVTVWSVVALTAACKVALFSLSSLPAATTWPGQ